MRARQKQRVVTDNWRSLGCRTTPLEQWSKRKPTVEPRWAKQQTKKLRPQPTKINSFMSGSSLSLKPDPPVAIKEGSKVINRDWVKHRLSHYIYVISNTFVTYDNFSELIRKISPTYHYFLNLYTKSP